MKRDFKNLATFPLRTVLSVMSVMFHDESDVNDVCVVHDVCVDHDVCDVHDG